MISSLQNSYSVYMAILNHTYKVDFVPSDSQVKHEYRNSAALISWDKKRKVHTYTCYTCICNTALSAQ